MGIELISAVQCPMSHSHFFMAETDEHAKLHEFFLPFQGIYTADFTPVRALMAMELPCPSLAQAGTILGWL